MGSNVASRKITNDDDKDQVVLYIIRSARRCGRRTCAYPHAGGVGDEGNGVVGQRPLEARKYSRPKSDIIRKLRVACIEDRH